MIINWWPQRSSSDSKVSKAPDWSFNNGFVKSWYGCGYIVNQMWFRKSMLNETCGDEIDEEPDKQRRIQWWKSDESDSMIIKQLITHSDSMIRMEQIVMGWWRFIMIQINLVIIVKSVWIEYWVYRWWN